MADRWLSVSSFVALSVRQEVLIPHGADPQDHEVATAMRLLALGFEVVFRERSNVPGTKNPDAMIDGEVWEFKSPVGSSVKNTISEQFKSAKGQAENLVIDLARCGLADEMAIAQIRHRFYGQIRFKQVIIIDHDQCFVRLP